jgi:hypothetical protein
MAKPFRVELQSLKNLISETELILSTTALPEGRTPRALELLRAAHTLTDDLLNQTTNPAAIMGHKGGSTTAKRGSDYFRELAARRKTRGGGRPRKQD